MVKQILLTLTFLITALLLIAQDSYIVDKNTGCKYYTSKPDQLHVVWTGDCQNSEITGDGVLKIYENETLVCTYEGSILNGRLHGYGTKSTPDGVTYVGDFNNGMFHGNGTVTLGNGMKYSGEWRNNSMNGYGVFQFGDGSSYEGEFENGVMNGKGKTSSPDGLIYEGEIKGNLPNGMGTTTYPNGRVETGNYVNGILVE